MVNSKSDFDSNLEFTRSVLEKGEDPELIVSQGQWCQIQIKRLFDSAILKTPDFDCEKLIGLDVGSDDYKIVRIRLGYFNTLIASVIHRAVQQMKLNELAQVSFEMDPYILDETFTPRANKTDKNERIFLDLNFEIRLVEIENLEPGVIDQSLPYKLNEYQLYDIALEHKKDANDLYQNKFVRTAFLRFHEAIKYAIIAQQISKEKKNKNLDVIDEEAENQIKPQISRAEFDANLLKLKSQLYSNMAICQLKSKCYDMVVINCTKCLEIDGNHNVKALFRRAQAYAAMNEFDEAIKDLNLAISLDKSNEELTQKLSQVEQSRKNYYQKFSANLKKMFD